MKMKTIKSALEATAQWGFCFTGLLPYVLFLFFLLFKKADMRSDDCMDLISEPSVKVSNTARAWKLAQELTRSTHSTAALRASPLSKVGFALSKL